MHNLHVPGDPSRVFSCGTLQQQQQQQQQQATSALQPGLKARAWLQESLSDPSLVQFYLSLPLSSSSCCNKRSYPRRHPPSSPQVNHTILCVPVPENPFGFPLSDAWFMAWGMEEWKFHSTASRRKSKLARKMDSMELFQYREEGTPPPPHPHPFQYREERTPNPYNIEKKGPPTPPPTPTQGVMVYGF